MPKPPLPTKPAAALFGLVPLASFVALGLGCGPKEPPKVPEVAKPKPLEVAPEPPVDLAALPEPKNVVALGRVARPEEASKLFAAWSGFPVPSAGEAVRAALGEELGEVLDLRGPVDMVASFEGGVKNPDVAFVVGGVPLPFAPGEVWYADFDRIHHVHNPGLAPRVHLVLDCVVNPWLLTQFEAATSRIQPAESAS